MSAPITYRELLEMSDDELIANHDTIVTTQSIGVGLNYYLEALRHKSQEQQNNRMVRYTLWITIMTAIVTVATILNAVLAYYLFRRG